MQCVYINLDASQDRRSSIESSFANGAEFGLTLSRFSAIDKKYVHEHQVAGSRSASEKGCFLSHLAVIEASMKNAEHLFVLEDDVKFIPPSFPLISALPETLNKKNVEWDIIYTDIMLTDIGDILECYAKKRWLGGKTSLNYLTPRIWISGAQRHIS